MLYPRRGARLYAGILKERHRRPASLHRLVTVPSGSDMTRLPAVEDGASDVRLGSRTLAYARRAAEALIIQSWTRRLPGNHELALWSLGFKL